MPVYARKSNQWKMTDVVFAYHKDAQGILQWREVKSAWVYSQGAWRLAFDRFQEPPVNVQGTNPTNSSGTLTWQAAPQATKYQVTVVDKATGAALSLANGGWTSELYYTVTQLLLDHQYVFSVKAARPVVGGSDAVSISSPKLTLSTGHPPTPRVETGRTVTIKASRSDTWSNDQHWGQTGGDVLQGYAKYKSQNAHGAIAYIGAYNQLADQVNYPTTVIPTGAPNAADYAVVTDAEIERIYRKLGGAVEPTVEVYAWKADFSSGTDPKFYDLPGTKTSFKAPEEATSRLNFDFDNLLDWVKEWVKKQPIHTGMLIYRTGDTGNSTVGFNGYCIFRAANTTDTEWRLKLTVSWNFNYPALQAPAWTAGG